MLNFFFTRIIDIRRLPSDRKCFGTRSERICAKRWRHITSHRSVNVANRTENRWVQKMKKETLVAVASHSEIRLYRITMASLLNTKRAVVLEKYRKPPRDQNLCAEVIELYRIINDTSCCGIYESRNISTNHVGKTISPKAELTLQTEILCAISPSYVNIVVYYAVFISATYITCSTYNIYSVYHVIII